VNIHEGSVLFGLTRDRSMAMAYSPRAGFLASAEETDGSKPQAVVPIHPLRVADPRSRRRIERYGGQAGAGRNPTGLRFERDDGWPTIGARLREAQRGEWNKDVGGSREEFHGRFLIK
jgi:hypothetical protein